MDSVASQYAPAMKVGGRRLSVSAKHKQSVSIDKANEDTKAKEEASDDYPRPAPPDGAEVLQQNQQEEEAPKKEKKNHEKPKQEYAHWKAEHTRPTRDLQGGNRGSSMGVRIAQPAGKSFGL